MRPLNRREFCLGAAALIVAACDEIPTENVNDGSPLDLAVPSPDAAKPDLAGQCAAGGNSVDAGPTSAVAAGDALYFGASHFFLCRDANGLFAMSSSCTHEACDVDFRPGSADFLCPCHQSQFAYDGSLLMGPAHVGLYHLAVCLDQNGDAIVDTGSIVPPDTRLKDGDS
jgi:Rieske Fe-S protein